MEEKQLRQYCYYVDIQGQTEARVTMCYSGPRMAMKQEEWKVIRWSRPSVLSLYATLCTVALNCYISHSSC